MSKVSAEIKREIFVEEYLKDFNGSRAVVAAGYTTKTPDVRAAQLLSDDRVKEMISAKTNIVIAEKRDDRERLRQLLEDAAHLDLTDLVLMGKTGCTLKEFKDIPKELRVLITEITNVSGKTGWKINFKVFSKEKATEILSRVYGLDKGNNGGLTINNYGNLAAIVDSFPD